MQLNWLSRFLHIKPASRTLCFHVGRGRVRGDLVRLLRDWQRFGVRDVTFDRKANTINARVDKANRKCSLLSKSTCMCNLHKLGLDGSYFSIQCLRGISILYFDVVLLHPVLNTDIDIAQTSRSSLCPSSSSSSSYWSMDSVPAFVLPVSRKLGVQPPASVRLSTSWKMCAAPNLCWLMTLKSRPP